MSVHHADPTMGLVASTIPFSSVDGPGNRFVVFFQGCNFDCVACHNPQTITHDAAASGARSMSVDELLAEIRRAAPFVSGVTVSGGEATQQPAFLFELLSAIAADPALARLTRLVDSNGGCGRAVWERLAPVMTGAMIDLKCLDPDIHRTMTGHPNDRVLESIADLASLGRLHEVRLLIMAGMNDDADLLRRTGEWLALVDPSMRIKIIGYRSHGARPHDPPLVPPSPDALAEAAAVVTSTGDFEIAVV